VRLILQKHKTGCGIASFAMMNNLTYEEAIKYVFPKRKKRSQYSTTIEDLTRGFHKLGKKIYWRSPLLDKKKVSLLGLRKNAILILDFGDGDYHAVVWNARRRAIFDPLLDQLIDFDKTRIKVSDRKYSMSVKAFYEKRIFAYLTIKKSP
jgi:hypothetical protein